MICWWVDPLSLGNCSSSSTAHIHTASDQPGLHIRSLKATLASLISTPSRILSPRRDNRLVIICSSMQNNISDWRLLYDELKCRHLILYFRYELSGKSRHLHGLVILQYSSTTLHPTLTSSDWVTIPCIWWNLETKLHRLSGKSFSVCLTRDMMLRNTQFRAVMRAENRWGGRATSTHFFLRLSLKQAAWCHTYDHYCGLSTSHPCESVSLVSAYCMHTTF